MENGLIFAACPIKYETHGNSIKIVHEMYRWQSEPRVETIGWESLYGSDEKVLVYRNGYADPCIIRPEEYENTMVCARRHILP